MLYTVIAEFDGSTFIQQIHADDLEALWFKWLDTNETPLMLSNKTYEEEYTLAPLDGLKNAWCASFVDDNEVFYLINVVATID